MLGVVSRSLSLSLALIHFLSIGLSVYMSVTLSICLLNSLSLPVYLPPSLSPSICLPLSLSLSLSLFSSPCLSLCHSVSVLLPVSLSGRLSLWVFAVGLSVRITWLQVGQHGRRWWGNKMFLSAQSRSNPLSSSPTAEPDYRKLVDGH